MRTIGYYDGNFESVLKSDRDLDDFISYAEERKVELTRIETLESGLGQVLPETFVLSPDKMIDAGLTRIIKTFIATNPDTNFHIVVPWLYQKKYFEEHIEGNRKFKNIKYITGPSRYASQLFRLIDSVS